MIIEKAVNGVNELHKIYCFAERGAEILQHNVSLQFHWIEQELESLDWMINPEVLNQIWTDDTHKNII